MREPLRGWLVGPGLVAALAAASCSAGPSTAAFSMPPATAPARAVLDAYLRAVVAGDCADARRLTTATFGRGNGELCGDPGVSDYKINPDPPGGGGTEQVYATTVTTGDSSDGSIRAGAMIWFYDLVQQPDGSWRIAGGGTGP